MNNLPWNEKNLLYRFKENFSDDIDYIINNLKFPHYEIFVWDDPRDSKYNGGCLVHNTYWKNISSILEKGLRIDLNQYYSNNFTWGVNLLACKEFYHTDWENAWTGAGGTSIIFKPNFQENYVEKLNDTDFSIQGNVPSSNIISIDFPFITEGINANSHRLYETFKMVQEYGLDEVKNTYLNNRCDYISIDDYYKIFDWIEEQL